MTLSKTQRIWLGIGSGVYVLAPFVLVAIMMGLWFLIMFGVISATEYSNEPPLIMLPLIFGQFFVVFPLGLCTVALQFVLIPLYVYHILKNQTAADSIRLLAILGLFIMPYIAMPAYYFVYIWPDPAPANLPSPASMASRCASSDKILAVFG